MASVGSGKQQGDGRPGASGHAGRHEYAVDSRDLYYARGRLRWLRKCLDELGERPATLLHFGGGHGAMTAEFFAQLAIRSLVGVEVSPASTHPAELLGTTDNVTFVHVADYRATASMDLAFTHAVIPRMTERERAAAAVLVFRSLKSGGLFAFWAQNPWNPLARLSANGSSGRPARPFTPPDARRLLRGVGFDIVHTTSMFYFPPLLSWCRPLEPMLASLPLGGQYMVLARKP
jgi:hypothetical protein